MYNAINKIKNLPLVIIAMGISIAANAQEFADHQLKKNVTDIESPLMKLVQLEPKIFEYNTQNYKHLNLQQGRQYGFLAENMQTIFPDFVKVKSISYMFGKNVYRNAQVKTIDEASLIPVLVASIKEQQQEIEKLKNEVEKLKRGTAVVAN